MRPSRRKLLEGAATLPLLSVAVSACEEMPNQFMTQGKSMRELTAAVRAGEASAASLAKAVVAAQDRWAALNGFISFDPEQLLSDANAKDALQGSGGPLGPLHGVPIALKDNINTADYPTSGGTPSLAGNQTSSDAPLAARLRAAGAVVAGKANMHELSAGGASDNHTFGVVGNPYDPNTVPGGSSGGPAALVAAGVVPWAIGTDTAGSVRVPAALCGVVGFRPSQGRYPSDGIVPLSISNDTAGPITRTVGDAALLDSVLADEPLEDLTAPEKIVLGVPRDTHFQSVHSDMLAAFEGTLERLQSSQIEIVEVEFSPVEARHKEIPPQVVSREFLVVMRDYLKTHGPEVSIDQLVAQIASPNVRGFMSEWLDLEPPDQAFQDLHSTVLEALRSEHQALFASAGINALIFPTTTQPALPRAPDDQVILNGETVSSWLYFANTRFAAVSGMPGISLPMGLSQDGLPLSLELDGLMGADRALLGVAAQVEAALGRIPAPKT